MNTDKNNSKINLLLTISFFGLLGLIGIALFISPNSVLAIAGLGSAVIAGIVAISNKDNIGDLLRKSFPKRLKGGNHPLDN